MNKRTERVKSIFDSDDSDEENNVTSRGLPYHKDDEEDKATKLRQTIEEVCSSLGNENDDSVELAKLSAKEPNIIINANDQEKIIHCSSDSEEENKNSEIDVGPRSEPIITKFVVPIIEENEYNLLSKFCSETVETSLEEENNAESLNFDEMKNNILEFNSSNTREDKKETSSISALDPYDPKETCIVESDVGDDIKLGTKTDIVTALPEVLALVQTKPSPISESSEEKIIDQCEASEESECFDSLSTEGIETSCNDMAILNEESNCENLPDNIIDNNNAQKEISSGKNNQHQCNLTTNISKEDNNQANLSEPSVDLDSKILEQENKEEENLEIMPRSSLDENVVEEPIINKEEENLEFNSRSTLPFDEHVAEEPLTNNDNGNLEINQQHASQLAVQVIDEPLINNKKENFTINPISASPLDESVIEEPLIDKESQNLESTPRFTSSLDEQVLDEPLMKEDKENLGVNSRSSSPLDEQLRKEENLEIYPKSTSPIDENLVVNKEEENLLINPIFTSLDEHELDDPLINKEIILQSKSSETNICMNLPLTISSALETKDNENSEPVTCEGIELKPSSDSTIGDNTLSSVEKITVQSSQNGELKNNSNCHSEGEKKRKVRVEDVFTDSESETAINSSPSKQPLVKNIEGGHSHDSNKGPPLKKIRRKRPRATSINLPAIMLAFEKGWVREVVYRASANLPVFPKRADIYYYTPEGKKLRSRIEIEDYLKKNNIIDLTLQNFSFFKEPLGVEECYEKIRHASISKLLMTPTFNEGDSTLNVAPKKRIRKLGMSSKDGVLPSKKLKMEMITKNGQEKDLVSRNNTLKETQRYYSSVGNFQNVFNTYSPVYATHLFPCNPPLSYPRIITSLIKGASKDKAFHCTPNCFAGGGNVPNLQCVKCICLFHPDCCHIPLTAVPLILSSQAKFLCPNCYKEETENIDEQEFTPVPCFEPLAYDPSSDSEDEGLCSDFEHPSYTRLCSRPPSPEITTSQLRQLRNLHSPNIAMLSPQPATSDSGICLGNSSLVQSSLMNDGLGPPMPQYMPPYMQNTNTNIISASAIKSGSALSIPLPSTYFLSAPSPPNSFPSTSPGISTIRDMTDSPSQPPQKKVCHSKTSKQISPLLTRGEHFMEDLSKCYNLLRHIFSYLSVADLLVVSKVCHMWRDLALGPTFWTSVRLRNVCVKDWGKMVEFLEIRGTTSLDLRKMVLRLGMASHAAGKINLENQFGKQFLDYHSCEDLDSENGGDCQKMNQDKEKGTLSKATDKVENVWASKNKDCKNIQLDMDKDSEGRDNEMNVSAQKIEEEETVLVTRDSVFSEKANKCGISEGIKEAKEMINEVSGIEYKDEAFDNLKQHDECDSIMDVNNILVKEIDSLNKNPSLIHSEKDKNIPHSSEDYQNLKKMESKGKFKERTSKKEAEEEKLKNVQKDKIVTSVLSEHDYFGTQVKDHETEGSSNSPLDSDDSESQLDQNEIEADRLLDEKLEFHKKNVEDGNLKDMLQWEHEPQVHSEWHVADASCDTGATQAKIGEEEEVELVCNLKENLKEKNNLDKPLYHEWEAISNALSNLRCLRNIIVGPCESIVLEILLSHCYQLTSITALNLTNSDNEDVISFDPSFLMHTKQLKEFRLGSKKNFLFKSNFNFIKLPDLKVLMLKGLKTAETGWPYLGIHLTHLHLSCINTFSHKNWLNISSMTGLFELELDGNGADFDSEICVALTKLVKLKRLTLLDWNIGPKLPFTLRKLHNINYLHIIPAVEAAGLQGIYAGRLMVMLDFTKHLEEFVWGIQPKNRMMDEKTGEKIFIQTMKPGKETGVMEGEKVRAIAIDSFKGFIKCRIPQTKVTVRKVASSNWITGDSWF